MKNLIGAIVLFIVFGIVCLGAQPLYTNWYSKIVGKGIGVDFGYFMFSFMCGVLSLFGCIFLATTYFEERKY